MGQGLLRSESDEELEEVELLSSESEFVDSRWFSSALTIPVTMGSLRICPKDKKSIFFCWRLLGLIPGGAAFSQLSRGVKDAMVASTKLVKCHLTKTCKKGR